MARSYRRRYYKRVYPRKRWASNIGTVSTRISYTHDQPVSFGYLELCKNSIQASNPTPVLIKFGRCKAKFDITPLVTAANQNTMFCIVYLMFVPQGIDLGQPDIVQPFVRNHPEYIMAWQQISLDSPSSLTLSSKLKRNLNSGDSVQLIFHSGINTEFPPSANLSYGITCTYQFYTTSV